MRLKDICREIEYECLSGSMQTEVSGLVYDSRKAAENTVFFCITGAVSDGHSYIPDVISKGVCAVVLEKEEYAAQIPGKITVIKVSSARRALAFMSAAFFGYPARKLKTIGITGTKGKTTTAYMIKSMLEMTGKKVGLIGTIGIMTADELIPTKNTTPESYELHRAFSQMVSAGCEYLVMEVSSQGLKLDRTAGIEFDLGVFTNLSPDHIGPAEHSSFEEYLYCKSLLLRQCKTGIVNADDPHVSEIIKDASCSIETFGLENDADLKASDLKLFSGSGVLGIRYRLGGKADMDVEVDIPGRFSVYNSLTAIAVCLHFTDDKELILKALKNVRVKGRVEIVPVSEKYTVIVDYAHNAVSLESILETLKEYEPKRLVCLFGCGGNRSKARRYEMGEVSSRLADLTIVTSDNPRFEKPEDIIEDIITGVKRTGGDYIVIENRKEAIFYALENAKEGDVIVIAGKGHEDYQEIKGIKYHYNDVETIMEYVKIKNI